MVIPLVGGVAFIAFGVLILTNRERISEMRDKWDKEHNPHLPDSRRFWDSNVVLSGVLAMVGGVALIAYGLIVL